jgi:hypothetical protein
MSQRDDDVRQGNSIGEGVPCQSCGVVVFGHGQDEATASEHAEPLPRSDSRLVRCFSCGELFTEILGQ